jgi:hypothetical protein
MSKEEDNKAVVGRWFTGFWGKNVNLAVVDEIAAPEMLLKYSLHEPRRGRDDIKGFMTDFVRLSRTSISGAQQISSPRATTSSVNGKAVAPRLARPSTSF